MTMYCVLLLVFLDFICFICGNVESNTGTASNAALS